MKKIKVPIFCEYSVIFHIGTKKEIIESTFKYLEGDHSREEIDHIITYNWGTAWNALKIQKNPLISIDSKIDIEQGVSTMAHEAVHAMQFISDQINVEDKNGEFIAQGVGHIMLAFAKHYELKKN